MAAGIIGDTLSSSLVKANRDFRGYRDLVGFFSKEFSPAGDPAVDQKIVGYVEEWLEFQFIELDYDCSEFGQLPHVATR